MNNYLLNEKKIILYGAGASSTILYTLFKENGIKLECYIDKRADEIKLINNIPVYTLEQLTDLSHQNKDDFCIIITPKNVFEHSEIAQLLFNLGYKNLVFKPKTLLLGNKNDILENINLAYDTLLLLKKSFTEPIKQFELNDQNKLSDTIIEETENYLKVWAPSELLYSNVSNTSIWSNLNMYTHFPLIDLYKLFSGQYLYFPEETIDNYIEYSSYGAQLINMHISESWKKNAIETRKLIFDEMQNIFLVYPDFFKENCPTVEYVNNNKLNIISSGKNRITFLMTHGNQFLPVKISKNDFKRWSENSNVIDLYYYLEKHQISTVNFPISHPLFKKLKVHFNNYLQLWGAEISIRLVKNLYKNTHSFNYYTINVLDLSVDNGCLRRYLGEIGFSVYYEYEDNIYTDYLDKAFNTKNIALDGNESNQFESIIIDSNNPNWKLYIHKLRFKQIFLLNWENNQSILDKLSEYNYSIKEKLFSSYNSLGYVTGYLLESCN